MKTVVILFGGASGRFGRYLRVTALAALLFGPFLIYAVT